MSRIASVLRWSTRHPGSNATRHPLSSSFAARSYSSA